MERLGKADNIPFSQLYYIAKNCTDRYYSKVIETFVSILKCQFANLQLLLVNTAQSLKVIEEYADHQAQIWKIFQKHQTMLDDIQDLHFHFDDFKNGIEKEFALLKEATLKNVGNFQTSLNLQQMYTASLCSHVNNMYVMHQQDCLFLSQLGLTSLQSGQNKESKGSNWSRPSELVNQTPPSKSDTAPFWCAKPQPIRGFPTIEPIMF